MPDTERSSRRHALLRSLRRWLPIPYARPDAGKAAVETAPRRQPARLPDSAAPVVWCHADDAADLEPLAGLLRRIAEEADRAEFQLTARGLVPRELLSSHFPAGAVLRKFPSEDPSEIQRFLDRNRPDLCIWTGGSYALNLIDAALDAGIPVINVDATFPNGILQRTRAIRRSLRQRMERFHAVYARDEASYRGMVKFGLRGDLLRNAGRMGTLPVVPPDDETLRAQLGRAIGNRPVWLAFGVRPDELPAVLQAYRDAVRLTHRLLLVLRPANRRDTERFTERLEAGDWNIVLRSAHQEPVYDTQIVLDDSGDELGLWLRVAPVAFLGNSLTRGGGTDPMPAAALGSAIVHGPFIATHREAYSKLTAAGGAVEVTSAKSLAEAVCEISFPDRAAAMAHAAWQVESEGAEVIRAVEQDILACLERRGDKP